MRELPNEILYYRAALGICISKGSSKAATERSENVTPLFRNQSGIVLRPSWPDAGMCCKPLLQQEIPLFSSDYGPDPAWPDSCQ